MSTKNPNTANTCNLQLETRNILRDHLLLDHKHNLHKLGTQQWTTIGLHTCNKCQNTTIFKTNGHLNRHIRDKHKTIKNGQDNITLLNTHFAPSPRHPQTIG